MTTAQTTKIANLTEMILAFENITLEAAKARATKEVMFKNSFILTDVTPVGYGPDEN